MSSQKLVNAPWAVVGDVDVWVQIDNPKLKEEGGISQNQQTSQFDSLVQVIRIFNSKRKI